MGAERNPEETIRAFVEDFNAERWDKVAGYMHASMTVKRRPPEPEARGRDAVLEYLKPDMFDRQRMELLRIERIGDAWLSTGRFHGRGAGSGIELTQEDALWWFRDGLIVRTEVYVDRDEAVAAARRSG